MFYCLYQIKNNVNGKIYIGVHKTSNLNDSYMGSGKLVQQAIRKYGVHNFTKTILELFPSRKEMYFREKEIVTEEFIQRRDVYNRNVGGDGGWSKEARKKALSPEVNKRRSKTVSVKVTGEKNPAFGSMWITDGVDNRKINKNENIPVGWCKGRTMPHGWGDNVRNKLKGRTHKEMLGEHRANELSQLKSAAMKKRHSKS